MTRELISIGKSVHGELDSADASTAVAVPLFDNDGTAPAALTIGSNERLGLISVEVGFGEVSAGNYSLFFDEASLATALAIDTATDGGAGVDTLTVVGDVADEYRVGRSFTIANATANDGTYTTTVAATYDAATDLTTITVATGSWTDGADDGDITSNISFTAGYGVKLGDLGIAGVGITEGRMTWPAQDPHFGPTGHRLCFVAAASSDRTTVVVDAVLRKVLTKTLPLARQGGTGS